MSTRGLIGFQIDSNIKATYNHSDSYPEGLGREVVNFMSCLSPNGIKKLKENVKNLRWVDENDKPSTTDMRTYVPFSDVYMGLLTNIDWRNLLLTTQDSRALPLIFSDVLGVMIDDTAFLNSPLYCEWAYIINFDQNTLDVYKGDHEGVAKSCSMVFSSPLNNCASAEQWLVDLDTAIKNLCTNEQL